MFCTSLKSVNPEFIAYFAINYGVISENYLHVMARRTFACYATVLILLLQINEFVVIIPTVLVPVTCSLWILCFRNSDGDSGVTWIFGDLGSRRRHSIQKDRRMWCIRR